MLEEEPEEEEGLGMRRGKSSVVEGLRRVSLAGGLGLEGKVRRTRTLTRIRESIRSNRSTGGGRTDVLPRKKSGMSLQSGSSPTSPVLEHIVEAEVVVERQPPELEERVVVEMISLR